MAQKCRQFSEGLMMESEVLVMLKKRRVKTLKNQKYLSINIPMTCGPLLVMRLPLSIPAAGRTTPQGPQVISAWILTVKLTGAIWYSS